MYKTLEIETIFGNQTHILIEHANGQFTSFPAQDENPNYQIYLEWVSEGNTAEALDLNTETTQE